MRRLTPFLVALLPLFFASGCVYALMARSTPTEVKLKLHTSSPSEYVARVDLESPTDYPVGADGRVQFTVPSLRNGCSVYCLGIKMHDGSAEALHVIELRHGERVVRRFSLADITKLSEDEDGFRVVKVRK